MRFVKAYTEPVDVAATTAGAEAFLAFLDALRKVAVHYPGGGDPNDLTLGHLRHREYSGYQWRTLVGPVDEGFVAHVRRTALRPIRSFAGRRVRRRIPPRPAGGHGIHPRRHHRLGRRLDHFLP